MNNLNNSHAEHEEEEEKKEEKVVREKKLTVLSSNTSHSNINDGNNQIAHKKYEQNSGKSFLRIPMTSVDQNESSDGQGNSGRLFKRQTTQGQRKPTYDFRKIPPDFSKALEHRLATSVGPEKAIKDLKEGEDINYCGCCARQIERKQLNLRCNIYELSFLGSGYPLYFQFLKQCIILLFLVLFFSGLFNVITNILGSKTCQETQTNNTITSVCKSASWVGIFSLGSKSDQKTLMEIQGYLNLASLIAMIFLLQFFRKLQRELDNKCDTEDISANDYTIVVNDIPKVIDAVNDDYDDDLKDFIEKNGVEGRQLKVQGITLCYNLEEIEKLDKKKKKLIEKKKNLMQQKFTIQKIINSYQTEKIQVNHEIAQSLNQIIFAETPKQLISSNQYSIKQLSSSGQGNQQQQKFASFPQKINLKGYNVNEQDVPQETEQEQIESNEDQKNNNNNNQYHVSVNSPQSDNKGEQKESNGTKYESENDNNLESNPEGQIQSIPYFVSPSFSRDQFQIITSNFDNQKYSPKQMFSTIQVNTKCEGQVQIPFETNIQCNNIQLVKSNFDLIPLISQREKHEDLQFNNSNQYDPDGEINGNLQSSNQLNNKINSSIDKINKVNRIKEVNVNKETSNKQPTFTFSKTEIYHDNEDFNDKAIKQSNQILITSPSSNCSKTKSNKGKKSSAQTFKNMSSLNKNSSSKNIQISGGNNEEQMNFFNSENQKKKNGELKINEPTNSEEQQLSNDQNKVINDIPSPDLIFESEFAKSNFTSQKILESNQNQASSYQQNSQPVLSIGSPSQKINDTITQKNQSNLGGGLTKSNAEDNLNFTQKNTSPKNYINNSNINNSNANQQKYCNNFVGVNGNIFQNTINIQQNNVIQFNSNSNNGDDQNIKNNNNKQNITIHINNNININNLVFANSPQDCLNINPSFINQASNVSSMRSEIPKVDLPDNVKPKLDAISKIERKKQTSLKELKGQMDDTLSKIALLENNISTITNNIKNLNSKLMEGKGKDFMKQYFTGTAFICFQFEQDKEEVIERYKEVSCEDKLVSKDIQIQRDLIYHNQKLQILQAPDPTDVNWMNLHYTKQEKTKRRWFSFLFTATSLLVCAATIYSFHLFQRYVQEGDSKSSTNSLQMQIVNTGLAILINILNVLLQIILKTASEACKYSTQTEINIFIAKGLSVARFVNSAIINFVIQIFLYDKNKQESLFGQGGLSDNANYFMISNCFVPAIAQLVNVEYYMVVIMRKLEFQKGDQSFLTQIELNEQSRLYENPVFQIEERYAQLLMTMFTTAFYCPIVPMAIVWSLIGIFLQYWIDKYNLIHRSSVKFNMSAALSIEMTEHLEYFLPIQSLSTLIFFYYANGGEWGISSIIGTSLGWLHAFLPMQLINERFFSVDKAETNSIDYEEAETFFITDYSRENPIYKEKARESHVKRMTIKVNNQKSLLTNFKSAVQNSMKANSLSKILKTLTKQDGEKPNTQKEEKPSEKVLEQSIEHEEQKSNSLNERQINLPRNSNRDFLSPQLTLCEDKNDKRFMYLANARTQETLKTHDEDQQGQIQTISKRNFKQQISAEPHLIEIEEEDQGKQQTDLKVKEVQTSEESYNESYFNSRIQGPNNLKISMVKISKKQNDVELTDLPQIESVPVPIEPSENIQFSLIQKEEEDDEGNKIKSPKCYPKSGQSYHLSIFSQDQQISQFKNSQDDNNESK